MTTKLLFIGLDAADKDLIVQWANAGLLPTFQTLLGNATWGCTRNPPGLFVGAVWPSFYTGGSPAQHARYSYRQIRPGSYETYVFRPFHVKQEPFWDTLSRAHKKVAVIDVPKTFPSKDLNGIHIVDWATHDSDPNGLCTWPPSLASEVVARFGEDVIGNCNADRRDPAEFVQFRDALVGRVEKKLQLSRYFLEQREWDCFLTVFSESHCVGHQCWHLHDLRHPRHDAQAVRIAGDPIKDVYIAIDAAIGKLLKQVGPHTLAIILASHGMGPHYDGTFLLGQILHRLQDVQVSKPYRRLARAMKWAWHQFPHRLRPRFSSLNTRVKNHLGLRRQCFQIPNNDVYGGIRIDLVGREPNGQINPGAEYDGFCRSLTQDLLEFVNLDTGEPLVRRVLRSAELYHGKYLSHLPDLIIEWNRNAPIATVYSPKTGTIQGTYRKCRTGDHKAEGLFFATGPSIRPGPVGQAVSVMDFAPSIASFLGVEPSNLDGKSMLPLVGIR